MIQYTDIVSRNIDFCDTQRENQYQCTWKKKKKVSLVLPCKASAHKPSKFWLLAMFQQICNHTYCTFKYIHTHFTKQALISTKLTKIWKPFYLVFIHNQPFLTPVFAPSPILMTTCQKHNDCESLCDIMTMRITTTQWWQIFQLLHF